MSAVAPRSDRQGDVLPLEGIPPTWEDRLYLGCRSMKRVVLEEHDAYEKGEVCNATLWGVTARLQGVALLPLALGKVIGAGMMGLAGMVQEAETCLEQSENPCRRGGRRRWFRAAELTLEDAGADGLRVVERIYPEYFYRKGCMDRFERASIDRRIELERSLRLTPPYSQLEMMPLAAREEKDEQPVPREESREASAEVRLSRRLQDVLRDRVPPPPSDSDEQLLTFGEEESEQEEFNAEEYRFLQNSPKEWSRGSSISSVDSWERVGECIPSAEQGGVGAVT